MSLTPLNSKNSNLVDMHEGIEPLFASRMFLLVHGEVQIHNPTLKVSFE